uniref:Uncharacterized protein n=1 Tax=Panagrellus redivivus TaxID=6233 RepID=A0A7E4VA44_PANRE
MLCVIFPFFCVHAGPPPPVPPQPHYAPQHPPPPSANNPFAQPPPAAAPQQVDHSAYSNPFGYPPASEAYASAPQPVPAQPNQQGHLGIYESTPYCKFLEEVYSTFLGEFSLKINETTLRVIPGFTGSCFFAPGGNFGWGDECRTQNFVKAPKI